MDYTCNIVLHIYKKGNATNYENYRRISLLNTCYKAYSEIISHRVNISENVISKVTNGLAREDHVLLYIFTMTQFSEKRRVHVSPTYIGFINYEKAFDKDRKECKYNGTVYQLFTNFEKAYDSEEMYWTIFSLKLVCI
jgi:hypothetical protein